MGGKPKFFYIHHLSPPSTKAKNPVSVLYFTASSLLIHHFISLFSSLSLPFIFRSLKIANTDSRLQTQVIEINYISFFIKEAKIFMALCSNMILSLVVLFISKGVSGTTFTFVNKCDFTLWPGILGTPTLDSTGFELPKGGSRSFQAPTGWSGRFWGRTGCNFDGSGHGSCSTGDCGSNQVECNGAGATPPATLAEFTLGSGTQDFYDVSLVDGYNLPMTVEVSGGSGSCAATGCAEDLNRKCPTELRVADGDACRSACEAFGSPEYCCSGEYSSPSTCTPSVYSQMFKSACPRSYSYAYDDATSTFTCTAADYIVTFCPSGRSQKSSKDSPKSTDGSGSSASEEMLANTGSWLAKLATGDSTRTHSSPPHPALLFAFILLLLLVSISQALSFL